MTVNSSSLASGLPSCFSSKKEGLLCLEGFQKVPDQTPIASGQAHLHLTIGYFHDSLIACGLRIQGRQDLENESRFLLLLGPRLLPSVVRECRRPGFGGASLAASRLLPAALCGCLCRQRCWCCF